ncbi:MAG: IS66 family transposase [Streptosporangiaceae bacterium]
MLGAFTERYSLLFLGQRTLESFRDFGILPAFAGVAVSDRYVNYFHPGWEHLAGHQACLAHLVRDYQDAAETYPDAIWPAQAQRGLRGLITAWHGAREQGLAAIPAATADPLITEFRRAVTVGLSQVPRIPGPKHSTAQHPGRDMLEFCRDREGDVLRFCHDTRIWPTNDLASHCTSWVRSAVSGLWRWSGRAAGVLFSIACGTDIFRQRAAEVGVVAAS